MNQDFTSFPIVFVRAQFWRHGRKSVEEKMGLRPGSDLSNARSTSPFVRSAGGASEEASSPRFASGRERLASREGGEPLCARSSHAHSNCKAKGTRTQGRWYNRSGKGIGGSIY